MTAPTVAPGPAPEPERRGATSAPWPHLRVVGAAEPRERRVTRLLTVGLLAAACAGLFAIVALRVLLAQGQVDIDRLESSIAGAQAAQQDLRVTVGQLEAPAQVVAAARRRLGMVTPVTVVYLHPSPAPAR